jgi:hypothetical protein
LKLDYFNPVVKDWNEAAQKEEIKQRKNCDYVLAKGFIWLRKKGDIENNNNKQRSFW